MIIYIANIIKNILSELLHYAKSRLLLAKVQASNRTCRFYPGVIIRNSELEHYNVIFQQTIILDSAIGAHTYIQKNSLIINSSIGKFCSIASKVTIGPGIHNVDGVSTHPTFYLKSTPLVKVYSDLDTFEFSKRTFIGNDVWIGEGVIIIDGVKVGDGAIIAAGAVVTKDVAPFSVVGGVPAKFIKFRFDEEVRNGILHSRWWDKDEEWLMKNYKEFVNPVSFIENTKNKH